MDNQDSPPFNPIPRSELVSLSLFGSPEARELARRLLPNTPEERDPEHPYFLVQFTAGSESEKNYLMSPAGKAIEALVNSADEELGVEPLELPTTQVEPLLPLPAAPKPAPVAEPNTLAETLLQERSHSRKVKLASWQVATATPPLDLGEVRPLDF
jgi:hypothetical protein